MWRPDDVVTEHKKRATALWVTLLLTTVGFIVWQTVTIFDKYHDPSTNFSVSDDIYRFPHTEVCMGQEFGCDWGSSRCIESVNATVLDPCDNEWKVQMESAQTSPGCVTFDMGQVETEAFSAKCLKGSQRPYVTVMMNWISDNKTSLEYSSSVTVFLGGADNYQEIWVPYTRFASPDDQLTREVWIAQTDVIIGKSVKSFLSGDDIITYPVMTSSTVYMITEDPAGWYYYISDYVFDSSTNSSSSVGENPAFGDLMFTLTQGSFSLMELSEENPIDMFGYIGNIGGFWEILLLVWGIFFISKHTDTPPVQEARNFSKTIKKGINMPNRPVAAKGPLRSTATYPEEVDLCEFPTLNKSPTCPLEASSSSIIHGRVSADEIIV